VFFFKKNNVTILQSKGQIFANSFGKKYIKHGSLDLEVPREEVVSDQHISDTLLKRLVILFGSGHVQQFPF
jgi:hypothetical protein